MFAAVVLLGSVSCSASGGGDAASCVGPVFGITPDPPPPAAGRWPSLGDVARGDSVTLYGKWYFAGPCQDTVTPRAASPSVSPASAVVLSLHTSDGAAHILATELPDNNAAFTATLALPVDAPIGQAAITDSRDHLIKLVITDA